MDNLIPIQSLSNFSRNYEDYNVVCVWTSSLVHTRQHSGDMYIAWKYSNEANVYKYAPISWSTHLFQQNLPLGLPLYRMYKIRKSGAASVKARSTPSVQRPVCLFTCHMPHTTTKKGQAGDEPGTSNGEPVRDSGAPLKGVGRLRTVSPLLLGKERAFHSPFLTQLEVMTRVRVACEPQEDSVRGAPRGRSSCSVGGC